MGTWFEQGTTWLNLGTGQISGGLEPVGMLLGSTAMGAPSDWDDWNNTVKNLTGSKPGAVNNGFAGYRSYSGGNIVSSYTNTNMAGDPDRGVISMWSCKPNLTSVLNGSLDATFTAFFNSINHQAWLSMWHEPYDDYADGVFTSEQYKAAHEHVYDLLEASNADRNLVKWYILLTAHDFRQGRANLFFPESGKYDGVGVDGYDRYQDPVTGIPLGTRPVGKYSKPATLWGPTVSFAASVGKPILVGEHSCHPDPNYLDGPSNVEGVPSRPYRLRLQLEYMAANNCTLFCLFHASGTTGPWWQDTIHNYVTWTDRSVPDAPSLRNVRDMAAIYGKAL
jgi:hypothetical protein